ncbi:acetyl/propionyl/methylcrotonyl-CoA carboxylase subunit alpha [Octadecabacter sp. G9-8]|uniref:Acetyl/propionyl/methylcrotonyl-CoA carboxylase subunit alpha n=1 Tax=Octadecabacter dasysiphoniae TaxID=2909341 RepID=A0ABS9CXW7_9RHOB|nr:acetyl/propionyl/methylcrotonyl-CoA carboxylase subunit alpha [Octadecabacter dasysiphoniae]MCF2872106.1 acetyl/propionyl/methylcrotonyl-CoA carboxylase subunit alpha [Octadecabacter dasysiphoniae]
MPVTDPIKTLLIANRGEIACRIMATAKARGITCVAVYSDADATARHVRMADIAIHIGGALAKDSYLRGDRIIAAAIDVGADAIHPGYGFLSENPDFVDAVEDAGLRFVGPSAAAIRAMGLKDQAKVLMIKAGVPVVPGYHGDNQDDAHLRDRADQIGYPVLIKAVAGGGGKGMRLAKNKGDFDDALGSARAEAQAAFGNDAVLIEKFITNPRHIEVQIFGDGDDVVHLYERDCSLQRRHQKIIEEAPAPGMTDDVRSAICSAAVTAGKAIKYSGAGTVEFIADGSGPLRADGFWFMEMNTRLQVEHPVTEAITGVDLVDWQLRVAGGSALPRAQKDIKLQGHAIEARLYAEDACNDFLPAVGRIEHLQFPPTLRVDSGVDAGDDISPYYDPMIAKLIAHADTRAAALAKLRQGLAATQIAGTTTNLGFLFNLVAHPDFDSGKVDTGLIERDLINLTAAAQATPQDAAQAAMELSGLMAPGDAHRGFTLHGPMTWQVALKSGTVALTPMSPDHVICDVGADRVTAKRHGETWRFDGKLARPHHAKTRQVTLFGAAPLTIAAFDPLDRHSTIDVGNGVITPMPGLLREVCVAVGAQVQTGQRLAVLEAMKMEHVLRAPHDGSVATITAQAGDQVQAGIVLITLDEHSGTD